MIQRTKLLLLAALLVYLAGSTSCADAALSTGPSQQPNNLTCTYDDGTSGSPGASWCRIDGYTHTCNGATGQWRPTGQKCH